MEGSYCESYIFEQTALMNGLKIKTQNTVIEKWPLKLKLRMGEPGFDEEFNNLFASDSWGWEAYLEWARADVET